MVQHAPSSVVSRLLEDDVMRKLKRKQVVEQAERVKEEEMSKFQNTSTMNKSKHNKRSKNDFLKDQIRYEDRKIEKLKNVRYTISFSISN